MSVELRVREGWLLRRTVLPSGTAICEVLTAEHGKLTVTCRGYAKSRKRYVGFEHWTPLELLLRGRTAERLSVVEVRTGVPLWHIREDYALQQLGAELLQWLTYVLPTAEPMPQVHRWWSEHLAVLDGQNLELWRVRIRLGVLSLLGGWGTVASAAGWADFCQQWPQYVGESEDLRRTLVWLEGADMELFLSMRERVPAEIVAKVAEIVTECEALYVQ